MAILKSLKDLRKLYMTLFIWFWLFLACMSPYSRLCFNDNISVKKRLSVCNQVNFLVGYLFNDYQRANLRYSQAIGLADLGRTEESIAAFGESWDLVAPPVVQRANSKPYSIENYLAKMSSRLTISDAAASALAAALNARHVEN